MSMNNRRLAQMMTTTGIEIATPKIMNIFLFSALLWYENRSSLSLRSTPNMNPTAAETLNAKSVAKTTKASRLSLPFSRFASVSNLSSAFSSHSTHLGANLFDEPDSYCSYCLCRHASAPSPNPIGTCKDVSDMFVHFTHHTLQSRDVSGRFVFHTLNVDWFNRTDPS